MEKLKYADLTALHSQTDDDPALDEKAGTTAALCDWAIGLKASDIPGPVLERVKHLILDGIACGLVGGHVPWSRQCAEAIMEYEPPGYCNVIGYDEVSTEKAVYYLCAWTSFLTLGLADATKRWDGRRLLAH